MALWENRSFYGAVGLAWILIFGWIATLVAYDRNFSPYPAVQPGEWINASSTKARFIGWSGVEQKNFRWSDGRVAKLLFRAASAVTSGGDGALEFRFNGSAGKQRVSIEMNGADLGGVDMDGSARVVRLTAPASLLRLDRDNEVILHISNPVSPGPHDPRNLGVAIVDFRYGAPP